LPKDSFAGFRVACFGLLVSCFTDTRVEPCMFSDTI